MSTNPDFCPFCGQAFQEGDVKAVKVESWLSVSGKPLGTWTKSDPPQYAHQACAEANVGGG